jgi:hypothetical protein
MKKRENIIVALKLFKERKEEGSWRARNCRVDSSIYLSIWKGRKSFILTPNHSINDGFGGNLLS